MAVVAAGLIWGLAALAAAGVVYSLAAALVAVRFFSGRLDPATVFPAITVIKPLHGLQDGLGETLSTYCRQDYPASVQLLFGVQSAKDPAIEVVRGLQADWPDMDIELVIDSRLHGANRKASNLINIAEHARHPLLVVSDADIEVESDYLRRIAGAMSAPGVGAATCLYVGRARAGVWATLSAMGIDYHFLPNAVLGQTLGLAEPCFGSTIALNRSVLEKIGGFAAFADHLADDYEIGRAVRAKGYEVAIPPMVVAHHCAETSWRELLAHELRWSRTVRLIDPGGHAGSLVTYPTALALLTALGSGFPLWSIGLIFASLGARFCLKACLDRATGARAGAWWLMPIRDILSFGFFLASFAGNTVGWQGRRFRVGPDGVLTHRK